jgi:uncharacterized membrane protein YagU involved in acid resistance
MDRVGAFSGAAYFILANAAIFIGADPATPDAPTGQQSLDALARMAANPVAQAAVGLEFLAFTLWMAFIGYVCWRLRAAGWVAAVALVGGVVEIAVKLGSAGPLISAYSLRDQISPEQAAILTQIGLADFMVGLLPAGLFVLCAAIAALRTQELGRVLAWSGIVIGAGNIVTAAVIGMNLPESGFAPSFLLILVWELVISLRWGFARNHPRARATVSPANPVVS